MSKSPRQVNCCMWAKDVCVCVCVCVCVWMLVCRCTRFNVDPFVPEPLRISWLDFVLLKPTLYNILLKTGKLHGWPLPVSWLLSQPFWGSLLFYFQEMASGQQRTCLWSVCFPKFRFHLILGEFKLIWNKMKTLFCFSTSVSIRRKNSSMSAPGRGHTVLPRWRVLESSVESKGIWMEYCLALFS